MSVLGERQKTAPWGLEGGLPGLKGRYYKVTLAGKEVTIDGKTTITLAAGESIVIETPGGGGWGNLAKRGQALIDSDHLDEKMA